MPFDTTPPGAPTLTGSPVSTAAPAVKSLASQSPDPSPAGAVSLSAQTPSTAPPVAKALPASQTPDTSPPGAKALPSSQTPDSSPPGAKALGGPTVDTSKPGAKALGSPTPDPSPAGAVSLSAQSPSTAAPVAPALSAEGLNTSPAGAVYLPPLSGDLPPVIVTDPEDAEVTEGDDATFSVVASGPQLTYQWKKDGVAMDGKTSATLTLSDVDDTDAADYICQVSNPAGTVNSAAATLTVTPAGVAPTITSQPQDAEITEGDDVAFSVTADGDPTLTYQWWKKPAGGSYAAIDGETAATLSLTAVPLGDDGAKYKCVVSNGIAPDATSDEATLTVNPPVELAAPTIESNDKYGFLLQNQETADLTLQRSDDNATWAGVGAILASDTLFDDGLALPFAHTAPTLFYYRVSDGTHFSTSTSGTSVGVPDAADLPVITDNHDGTADVAFSTFLAANAIEHSTLEVRINSGAWADYGGQLSGLNDGDTVEARAADKNAFGDGPKSATGITIAI